MTTMPGALEVFEATRGAGVGVVAMLREDEEEVDLAEEEEERTLEDVEARVEDEEDKGVVLVSGSSSSTGVLGRGAWLEELEGWGGF